MAQFCEIKKIGQKLKSLEYEQFGENKKYHGFKTDLTVEIKGMGPGNFNNGQLNGEIQNYQASFTVRNNRIFGFKDMNVQILTNGSWQDVENLPDDLPDTSMHNVSVEG